MKFRKILLVGLSFSLFSCANPLNKATYFRHLDNGMQAEAQGDSVLAEEVYSRALGNVYIGNLGPEREAEALFNLGRVERINGKQNDSLKHLLKSLELDENINKASEDTINGTLAEIAKTFYEKGQYEEGELYLSRITKLENTIFSSEQAKTFLKKLFKNYAEKLEEIGLTEKAAIYRKMATTQ